MSNFGTRGFADDKFSIRGENNDSVKCLLNRFGTTSFSFDGSNRVSIF